MKKLIDLSPEHVLIVEQYGIEQGMIATRGRAVGSVDFTAVMRRAIELLPLNRAVYVAQIPSESNGK